MGIALSVKDKNHLKKFKRAIDSEHPIYEYEPTDSAWSNNNYCRIQIFGYEIYKNLEDKGVIEHKTDRLTPPDLEDKYKPDFIRGYFDGDGSLYSYVPKKHNTDTESYTVKICGTKAILDYISGYFIDNGISVSQHYSKRKSFNETYTFECGGPRKAEEVLDLIYVNPPHLDRKYKKYLQLKKRNKEVPYNFRQ